MDKRENYDATNTEGDYCDTWVQPGCRLKDGQGVDLNNEWLNLDDDDVKTLLQNFQKPSGGEAGNMISFKAEMNLHLTIFLVDQKKPTS